MTEDERQDRRKRFIDKYKHEIAGMALDGSIARTGGEMAFWARGIMHRTDAMLAKMFDDLLPAPKIPLSPEGQAAIQAAADKVTNRQPPVKR